MSKSSSHPARWRDRKSRLACALAVLCLGLTGCSVHNMWNVHERTQTEALTSVRYPVHEQKVFLTESGLPAEAIGDTLAQIDVGEVSYQSTEVVLQRMAEQARAVGANVVMNVRIWRGGGGWSWVAPQSSGTAVRLTDTNAIATLNGYWY